MRAAALFLLLCPSIVCAAPRPPGWPIYSRDFDLPCTTGHYFDPVTRRMLCVIPAATAADPNISGITVVDTTVEVNASTQLSATCTGTGDIDASVGWTIPEGAEGCSGSGATVTADGIYTAPITAGTCGVLASCTGAPTISAVLTVIVTAAPAAALAVTPVTSTVTSSRTVVLTATGGDGTYSWSITTNASGSSISATSGASIVYTSGTLNGTDVVTVTSDGVSKTASVIVSTGGVQPAFPGAEGAGAIAKGGRGGAVLLVTNLNDTGAGSLRACVEATGPRTCVFRTGGVINLSRGFRLFSSHAYLTVAGETAPGDGIVLNLATHTGSATTIPNAIFDLQGTHDIVLRYLRLWGDYVVDQAQSNIGTLAVNSQRSYNVIVDHCTMLWHSWEPVCVGGASSTHGQVTFSNNLLAECVLSPVDSTPPPDSSPQAVAMIVAGENYDAALLREVDIHHNVFASCGHRNPIVNGRGRIVNNLVYNWMNWATRVDSAIGTTQYDAIGNYYKPGPMLSTYNMMEVMLSRGTGSVYVAGNKADLTGSETGAVPAGRGAVTGAETADQQWTLLTGYSPTYSGQFTDAGGTQPAPTAWKRAAALPASGIAITTDAVAGIQAALTNTSTGVGAGRRLKTDTGDTGACLGGWVDKSDSARDRVLAYVVAGTGAPSSRLASAVAYQTTLPTPAAGTACTDTDSDGLPDAFENAACSTNICLDPSALRPDGYTVLECYLAGNAGADCTAGGGSPPACGNLIATGNTEEFDAAGWAASGATVDDQTAATTDPLGTNLADKIIEGNAAGEHRVSYATTEDAGTYTFSVYGKAAERTSLELRGTTSGCFAYFSLSTGSFLGGNKTYPGCASVGSGWYRCSITCTVTANATLYVNVTQGTTGSYTGDGTSGLYLWGAQLDAGSSAAAYCAP